MAKLAVEYDDQAKHYLVVGDMSTGTLVMSAPLETQDAAEDYARRLIAFMNEAVKDLIAEYKTQHPIILA